MKYSELMIMRATHSAMMSRAVTGNAMTPPQLTRDTPVLEVFHPRHVRLRPAARVEGDLAVGNHVRCRPLELVDGDEPLLGQPRLERRITTVAVHDGVLVVIHVVE